MRVCMCTFVVSPSNVSLTRTTTQQTELADGGWHNGLDEAACQDPGAAPHGGAHGLKCRCHTT